MRGHFERKVQMLTDQRVKVFAHPQDGLKMETDSEDFIDISSEIRTLVPA
jgi:hypothetical protein